MYVPAEDIARVEIALSAFAVASLPARIRLPAAVTVL